MNTLNSRIGRFLPLPKSLSFDSVGLDIGPEGIRVLKLTETKFGLIPEMYKSVTFSNPINLKEIEQDSEDGRFLVQKLQELKKELSLKYVVVALPEEKNYIYQTEFPFKALADIGSAIELNLEENVPLQSENSTFNYQITHAKEDLIEVIVSVFPNEVIETYTSILIKAGLVPLSFVPESEAISKAVVSNGEDDPVLVVNLMDNLLSVSIVEHEIVHYTSKIQLECQKLKADDDSEEAKILNRELNKTLIYWFTNKRGLSEVKKIEKAILVGKMADLDGLVEYLENSLKIDVELGQVWTNCFSTNEHIPEITMKESLEYPTVVGLALRAKMKN